MQERHHLLTLSKGVQADTTNYFVVWWVLFECSSFDHFPNNEKKSSFISKSFNISYITRKPAFAGSLPTLAKTKKAI